MNNLSTLFPGHVRSLVDDRVKWERALLSRENWVAVAFDRRNHSMLVGLPRKGIYIRKS